MSVQLKRSGIKNFRGFQVSRPMAWTQQFWGWRFGCWGELCPHATPAVAEEAAASPNAARIKGRHRF